MKRLRVLHISRSSIAVLTLLSTIFLSGCTSLNHPPKITNVEVLVADQTRNSKFEGLKQGLSDLGYGAEQLHFGVSNALGSSEKLKTNAEEMVNRAPDLLVATGLAEAEAILSSLKPNSKIPVIMIGVTEAADLAHQFEDMGTPVTGVDNGHVELTGKRLELLRLLFPERPKILAVYDPSIKASLQALDQVRAFVELNHIRFEFIPVSEKIGLKNLQNHLFQGNEAILLLPSYFIEGQYRQIRDLELKHGIPVMGFYHTEVTTGYAAAYGLSSYAQGYQAARLAVRMLKEKRSIPFDMPDSVQLEINLQAIKAIGEKVSLVGQSFADKVDTIQH